MTFIYSSLLKRKLVYYAHVLTSLRTCLKSQSKGDTFFLTFYRRRYEKRIPHYGVDSRYPFYYCRYLYVRQPDCKPGIAFVFFRSGYVYKWRL